MKQGITMEYNKRNYAIKNSVSHLELVPEVAVVHCVYATFPNDPGTQGENTLSPNSFPKCYCTIAASKSNLQQLAEHFTSTNFNIILVRTENINTPFI